MQIMKHRNLHYLINQCHLINLIKGKIKKKKKEQPKGVKKCNPTETEIM